MLAAILPWLWDKIAWWEILALFVLWCWIYDKTMSRGAVFGSRPTIYERFDEINDRLYDMEQDAEGEVEQENQLEEWKQKRKTKSKKDKKEWRERTGYITKEKRLDDIERRLGKLEPPQTNDD